MSNLTLSTHMIPADFSNWDQYLIGVDHLMRLMDESSQATQGGYPPHNVIRRDPDHYAIEMAVAGFGEEDLNIVVHNGRLVITGDIQNKDKNVEYIKQGLSRRRFERSFQLVEHVEVTSATVRNGILTVELERRLPEALKPRSIAINFAH